MLVALSDLSVIGIEIEVRCGGIRKRQGDEGWIVRQWRQRERQGTRRVREGIIEVQAAGHRVVNRGQIRGQHKSILYLTMTWASHFPGEVRETQERLEGQRTRKQSEPGQTE